ncbi:MAG: hypothetical protein U9O94_02945 [Nanoarchaeota archaeon]|nr:hypothetical protein [Nanoarchaeota archaeon]
MTKCPHCDKEIKGAVMMAKGGDPDLVRVIYSSMKFIPRLIAFVVSSYVKRNYVRKEWKENMLDLQKRLKAEGWNE